MCFSKYQLIDSIDGHIPESIVNLVENFKFEKFGYDIDTVLNTDLDLDSKILVGMYLIVAMADGYDTIITPHIDTILNTEPINYRHLLTQILIPFYRLLNSYNNIFFGW